MFLDTFHTKTDSTVSVSGAQASQFAKQIADDFNPLHDEGGKRFCVPGDLLFALVLSRYGISEHMSFSFGGMVGADTPLTFPADVQNEVCIAGDTGKTYLTAQRSGNTTENPAFIEAFIRQYVAFSGQNFPHILVPLMRSKNVMINPARPLVIYESMAFDLQRFDTDDIRLSHGHASLEVDGKRGDVGLFFNIESNGEVIGSGVKKLVLSGLREFDELRMQEICDEYDRRKVNFAG